MKRTVLSMLALLVSACSTEPKPPVLVMSTDAGDIEIEMAVMEAPLTASNFIRLAEGGHLDGAGFYRVVRPDNDNGEPVISVIQGGVQDGLQPFPPIPHEHTEQTGLSHVDGAISMARMGPGTASTEFFISIGDQPALDFGNYRNPDGLGFAVFGKVVRGMDVVRAIHSTPDEQLGGRDYTAGQVLVEPVTIRSVRLK